MTLTKAAIPLRLLATLLAYVDTGSHKRAAQRMGITEAACRKRVARVLKSVDARNVTQAVWRLRVELGELEAGARLA